MSESIDQIDMRQSNLALVLSEIIRIPRSRAQLSSDIDMTKGAVGNLVNELIDRGLVALATATHSGSVGRPSRVVEAVPSRAHSIGISFSPPYIVGAAVDLAGNVVREEKETLVQRFTPVEDLIAITTAITTRLHKAVRERSPRSVLAGVAVGVPDLVDPSAGVVRRSPTVGLVDYPLVEELRLALGGLTQTITIDNDATFGAIAEARRLGADGGRNLLYLTGSSAMGGGIVSDGVPFRGSAGYAGEVGHMIINPDGKLCVCGNLGCWESEIGLNAFLALAADPEDPVRDGTIDGNERITAIVQRADAGDPRTLQAIEQVARFLGLGLSSLINIFNPDTVILGGYFIRLFPFLIDTVQQLVSRRVLSDDLLSCRILHSDLEMYAAAIGAGISAIDAVVSNPAAVPNVTETNPVAASF
ncbi:ROK family protein [Microbacterium sp.]|uniref:ROK family protein n=1 Tax=Microbacterium sp. TaxID=51671 RepID=UPI003A942852